MVSILRQLIHHLFYKLVKSVHHNLVKPKLLLLPQTQRFSVYYHKKKNRLKQIFTTEKLGSGNALHFLNVNDFINQLIVPALFCWWCNDLCCLCFIAEALHDALEKELNEVNFKFMKLKKSIINH